MRLRLALFACGAGDAAELRGWYRWRHWRQRSTLRWQVGLARDVVLLPARAARDARAAVRLLGTEVTQERGGSRPRQFVQLWWLRVRYGIDTAAYVMFRLYLPERRRRAAQYIQVRELARVTGLIIGRVGGGEEAQLLSDKDRFAAWCQQHALAAVPTLPQVGPGGPTAGTVAPEALPPGRDLFTKPVRGQSGVGARLWRAVPSGGYAEGDGPAIQPTELIGELAAMATALDRAILVQARLRTHRALGALTLGGLCTLRLVTFRPALGGAVELINGTYKMPAGNAVVDNVAQGAVVAHIDLATGRLGAAVRWGGQLFLDTDRHPDTRTRIGGTELPHWAQTVDLVTRAHRATERLVILGWDVAITDDGPVLIEGNTLPGSRVMQLVPGVPLADTSLVGELNRLLRESYGI